MDKTSLRNNLFEKYFENKDGIVASDLVTTLSLIPETWRKLHHLCEENLEFFESYSNLRQCKIISVNNNYYLILESSLFNYVIIDINKMQNISKKILDSDFNNEVFINNFNERKVDFDISKLRIIEPFNNPKSLIDFYFQNQKILSLSKSLKYQIAIDNAWTYFFIDFANATAQLGFQTLDQFLYEQLFLKYDLTASKMQDAQSRIGLEKMKEMFTRIKTIKIPLDVIPHDLYEQYKLQKKLSKAPQK